MSDQDSDLNKEPENSRLLVLDTETTGISYEAGHKIIEIALIEKINGEKTGNDFHVYLNPEREVEEGAQEVHGLDWENLMIMSEGRVFNDIAYDLASYMRGAHVVAHNAPFDFGHLDAEYRRLGLPEISQYVKISDSYKLANNLYTGRRNNLDSLAKRLNVDTSSRELHGAMIDADILSEVYDKLVQKQKEIGLSNKSESNFNIDNRRKIQFTPIEKDLSDTLRVISSTEDENSLNDSMSLRIQKASGDDGFSF